MNPSQTSALKHAVTALKDVSNDRLAELHLEWQYGRTKSSIEREEFGLYTALPRQVPHPRLAQDGTGDRDSPPAEG